MKMGFFCHACFYRFQTSSRLILVIFCPQTNISKYRASFKVCREDVYLFMTRIGHYVTQVCHQKGCSQLSLCTQQKARALRVSTRQIKMLEEIQTAFQKSHDTDRLRRIEDQTNDTFRPEKVKALINTGNVMEMISIHVCACHVKFRSLITLMWKNKVRHT